jgi:hypothetical protein
MHDGAGCQRSADGIAGHVIDDGSGHGRRDNGQRRRPRHDTGFADESLKMKLGLEPVQLFVPTVLLPELFRDHGYQPVGEVELSVRLLKWADGESHACRPLDVDVIIIGVSAPARDAELSPIGRSHHLFASHGRPGEELFPGRCCAPCCPIDPAMPECHKHRSSSRLEDAQ